MIQKVTWKSRAVVGISLCLACVADSRFSGLSIIYCGCYNSGKTLHLKSFCFIPKRQFCEYTFPFEREKGWRKQSRICFFSLSSREDTALLIMTCTSESPLGWKECLLEMKLFRFGSRQETGPYRPKADGSHHFPVSSYYGSFSGTKQKQSVKALCVFIQCSNPKSHEINLPLTESFWLGPCTSKICVTWGKQTNKTTKKTLNDWFKLTSGK